MQGQNCPGQSVKFTIKKISDILGNAVHEFYVPVPVQSSGEGQFAGVKELDSGGENVDSEADVVIDDEKLAVESIEISVDGVLTMKFNKPIIMPNIRQKDDAENSLRALQGQAIELEDFLEVRVLDQDIELDLDLEICRLDLLGLTEMEMSIAIRFCQPQDITVDITVPNVLEVVFKMPALIIDASTFEELDSTQITQEIELAPQISPEEQTRLGELATAVAKIGMTISFWQVVLFLSIGKALKAMWSLLFAIQFVIYVSQWQIKFYNDLRIILREMQRIAFGEFLDDFDFMNEATNFFGIDSTKDDSVQDKIGEDRLAGENIW